ncbi:protein kinase [candidate division KSB1 bacterium]|nr:protein kinase [candidate division KSB1 bacterium]
MKNKIISHYKIIEKIDEGGMGIVYKAEDLKLKRIVALKFLPPGLTQDCEAEKRFIREARAASALDHPNICTIHQIGETEDGQVFIVMPCYQGETLAERIEKKPIEIDEAIDITIQIAKGLAKAHENGIVHRDIKPANIMLTDDGVAKILDFGLVKLSSQTELTLPGMTLGTVAYMSPEQTRGEAIDHRTDIWSLGVMLYKMLTGKVPFRGASDHAVMYAITNDEPQPISQVRPDLPLRLAGIVHKALAKAPDNRYPHMERLLKDLIAFQKQPDAATSTSTGGYRLPLVLKFLQHIIIALLVLGAAAVIYFSGIFAPGASRTIDSIAVLPLQNFSGDTDQQYLIDGMTEALITELSRIKALKVISRTSVMRYRDAAKPLPEIAKELGVNAVIEGSGQLAGNRIRITVQLVDAATDRNLWAEHYDRDLKDILKLQSELARTIAKKIRIMITPEEHRRLQMALQVDPKIHEAYLRGRYFINKWTEPDLMKGITFLRQAVAADPDFAPAHSALARAYEFLIWLGWMPAHDGWHIIEAEAERALQLDETLAEAHVMLAEKRCLFDYNWRAAEAGYKRALEFNPGYVTAHVEYAWFLCAMQRNEEALQEINLAKTLDPLSPIVLRTAAWIYCRVRNYDRAIQHARELLILDSDHAPTHSMLGSIYAYQKRFEESIAEYKKAIDLWGENYPEPALARTLALSGEKTKARAILKTLLTQSNQRNLSAYRIAKIYLSLGENEQAFLWLEKAYTGRDYRLIGLNVDPFWDSIRADPKFYALLKKMKLSE